MAATDPDRRRRARRRLTIGELIALVLGIGFGFWVFLPRIRGDSEQLVDIYRAWLWVLLAVLGGASLVGVPLLLPGRRRRPRRRWGPGEVLWFAHGASAWLLWPPIVAARVTRPSGERVSTAEVCFAHGTPLMAVYVTAALLLGGWIRPRRRRGRPRRPLPWRERFGLLLGAAWACLGVYVLWLIYREPWD